MHKIIFESSKNIVLRPIFSKHHKPDIMKIKIEARTRHAFMYVIDGCFLYSAPGFELNVQKGQVLYLPGGSTYDYQILSETVECIQIEFDVITEKGQPVYSRLPHLLPEIQNAEEIFMLMTDEHNKNTLTGYCNTLSELFKLFAIMVASVNESESKQNTQSKIAPAVHFLDTHPASKIAIADLATKCCISQSQLRRLFLKEYGLSPVAYRNRKKIEKAALLLSGEYHNVSETAEILGFDSVYSFSQMFKKQTGLSPSAYIKMYKDKDTAL